MHPGLKFRGNQIIWHPVMTISYAYPFLCLYLEALCRIIKNTAPPLGYFFFSYNTASERWLQIGTSKMESL